MEECEPCPVFCEFYPGICLTTEEKATEVYTDCSKTGDNVGAGGFIFVNDRMVHQLKFKLHGHCSNNQAEQIAILKVLENNNIE